MTTGEREHNPPLAQAFTHAGVAGAYEYRPPYPADVFRVLDGLITDRPRRVLDIGAGDGALARPLAERAEHVTALDMSSAMVEQGRRRPGGQAPNLRWTVGAAEDAELDGPYALVTAGASLHWMRWRETLRHVASAMTGNAVLAIVDQDYRGLPWRPELTKLIRRHSRSPGYDPDFRIADALADTGLFAVAGTAETEPVIFRQPAAHYVEQFHSTASLAREWMTEDEAEEFDRAMAAVVAPYATDGMLDLPVVAQVCWGRVR